MRRKNIIRLLIVSLALIWFVAGSPSRQAQRTLTVPDFSKNIQPFFSANCYMCHNDKLKSGGLNLEQFNSAASIAQNRETWENVLMKLRTGEMPPKGLPRPNEGELKAVIHWLELEFSRADRLVKPNPGRVTARRLNRAEYNNTIRDLLGVDLHPADDFPQDDSGYGFDNIGDVLSLSPVLMEKYLTAAEKIARSAVFGPEQLKPTMVQHRVPGRRIVPSTTPLVDYDVTGLSMPNAVHATHRFPVDGDYNIRVVLGGVRPAGSEPLQIGLWVDGQKVEVINFDPENIASFSDDRQDFGGMTQEFRAKFKAGDHWIAASVVRMYEGLPPSYGGPNPSKRPTPPPPEFRPPRNLPPEKVAEFKKRFEARLKEKVPVNEARISYLEVRGPYEQSKGPSAESLKKIYTCGHINSSGSFAGHQQACARKIIANLARRAYRRPVTPEEVNQLVNLVSLARKEGDSFQEGICQAMQAMLVSPHFLFRIEKGARQKITPATQETAKAPHLSQHELASRLSYFLWSTMPDDELMRLADQGLLRNRAVLNRQVRRMLKDPKSRALVENFGGQWLELRKLEAVKPDRQRFPDFDEYLRMSMRRETEMFFENIMREDRSVLDFIDTNYTYLNERLAQFYKVGGVKGPEFRKVLLSGDKHRGGIVTQASILTISSYATRTSPVLRGKWILETILNAPPPPPPPDVPNLDEAAVGSSASLRQQLEQHRQNATCAACHARMDPLGFGLENFDAIGGWRTQDGKFPIDPSGTLPDGRSFKGPDELKTILKADREAFAESISEKLLTYALGRGLERYDKPTVKQIAKGLAADDYRFSSLALEIVNSLPFQMRK
jgi:cytochrome c5